MNISEVAQTLQATFHPDSNYRNNAESHLKKLELQEGFVVSLLKIICAVDVDYSIRLSASINLKRVARSRWSRDDKYEPERKILSDDDKQFLKSNIINAISISDGKIRAQLGVVMRNMVSEDFPEKWNSLIPEIMSTFSFQDMNRLSAGLEAFYHTIKKYQYVPPAKNEREPLNQIVDATFPTLFQLFAHIYQMEIPKRDNLLKVIIKVFWCAINFGVPPYLNNDKNLEMWMNGFFQIMDKPIPVEIQPEDPEERKSMAAWKCKKWISAIFVRMYNRYRDPTIHENEFSQQFSKKFSKTYAPTIFEVFMKVLATKDSQGTIDSVVRYALTFLDSALMHNNIYKLMKPHVDSLFQSVLFPMFRFTEEESELWESDPHEFIRREYDVWEEFFSPKIAAQNLVIDIAKRRGKNHLHSMMSFIAHVLTQYNTSTQKDYSSKDAALYVVGSLADKLTKIDAFKPQLEAMMVTNVLPELQSPYGFLRAKAVWVFTQFYDMKYSSPDNFLNGVRASLNLLHDSELPVRIQAAVCLKWIIYQETASPVVRPLLPNILDAFFKLMSEIDNDELISTLSVIIETFEEDMAPYCTTLCSKLVESFMKCIEDASEEDDEPSESGSAALEVMGTIQTVLYSIREKPHLYPQVEPIIFPLLLKLINPDELEFVEDAMKIVTFFTFYPPTISPEMWSLFPKIYEIFQSFGEDFIGDILNPLDNYISRGTDTFLSNNYMEVVFDICQKILRGENAGQDSCGEAAKLIGIILLSCRGRIDQYIEPFMEMAAVRLPNINKNSIKILILEVFINGIYYNPPLALKIMEKRGWTSTVFTEWFHLIQHLPRKYDKKLSILSLSCLLALPQESLPEAVKSGLNHILMGIMKLFENLERQKKAEQEEEEENDEAYDSDVSEGEIEEEDDLDDDETFKNLVNQAAKYSEEYDDDEISDLEDEEEVITPIDDVNEALFFLQNLNAFSQQNPSLYQQFSSQVNAEQMNHIVQLATPSQ